MGDVDSIKSPKKSHKNKHIKQITKIIVANMNSMELNKSKSSKHIANKQPEAPRSANFLKKDKRIKL